MCVSLLRIPSGFQGRCGKAQKTGLIRRGRPGLLVVPSMFCCPHCSPSLSPCCSLNHRKKLVNLSFLSCDTGKPDVFPASLGLPLLKQEERKTEAEERDHQEAEEKEKKNQKRKEKRSQKGQEETQLPSKEMPKPQKLHPKKQGKRPRLESGSEQVGHRDDGLPSCEKESVSKPSRAAPHLLTFSWTESSMGVEAGPWVVLGGAERGPCPGPADGASAWRVVWHFSHLLVRKE